MHAQKAGCFYQQLMSFLLTYWITPHTTTNLEQDLILCDQTYVSGKVVSKQAQQKHYLDKVVENCLLDRE